MKAWIRSSALVVGLSLSLASFADDAPPPSVPSLYDADLALKNQDYKTAISLYEKLALRPGGIAQYQLGYLHLNGLGVDKDASEASAWFRQSSAFGFSYGQFALAMCYFYGLGVQQGINESIPLFQQSAKNNNPLAQYMLGYLYATGQGGLGVQPDLAIEWYSKAAVQKVLPAQYNLGREYYLGEGATQDYSKALTWFTAAANEGMPKAEFMLGLMNSLGQATVANKAEAYQWYTKAAQQGVPQAEYNLGVLFYTGQGTAVSLPNAVAWIIKAAQHNLPRAEYVLGYMIKNGIGVQKNPQTAVAWFNRAAVEGLAEAQFELAMLYHTGQEGLLKDDQQAFSWLSVAAKQGGLAEAQAMLASFYRTGTGGIDLDPKLAAYWYEKAALQGLDTAQLDLGGMYMQQGGAKNLIEAYAWLNLAAQSADPKTRDDAIKMRETAGKSMTPSDIKIATMKSESYKSKFKQ